MAEYRDPAEGKYVRHTRVVAALWACTVLTALPFFAAPDLRPYHKPADMAYFIDTAPGLINGFVLICDTLAAPIRNLVQRLPGETQWQAVMLLFTVMPLAGCGALACAGWLIWKRRPYERLLAIGLAAVNVPLTLYAFIVAWFALMKAHFI